MSNAVFFFELRQSKITGQQYFTIIDSASVLQLTYSGFYKLRRRYGVEPVPNGRLYLFSREDILYLLGKHINSRVYNYLGSAGLQGLPPEAANAIYSALRNFFTRSYSYADPAVIGRMVDDAYANYIKKWCTT
jgi:hypothetical protein